MAVDQPLVAVAAPAAFMVGLLLSGRLRLVSALRVVAVDEVGKVLKARGPSS